MTTEIVRHEAGDALSQVLGTGDTRAMLEQVERNVKDIIAVARDRGFVRKYGNNDNEFFGLPAWQLLAMTYGLVPFIEWTRPVDNGWEARAVVKTRDGQEVGAAEAMCTRGESNRRNADDHTLRAMAQTRANRNALRGALGAALVLAGFDFPDPDAPATNDQIGLLHQLERDHDWTHDEGHGRAGVESYKDLTREGASTLIDAWGQEQTPPQGGQASDRSGEGSAEPSAPEGPGPGATDPSPSEVDGPATKAQVERANALGLTDSAIVVKVRKLFQGVEPRDVGEVTRLQLAAVIKERMGP